MTIFFKSHQIQIRTERSVGTDRWAFSATGTVYDADIQPTTEERAQFYGGRIGKTFAAWVADDVPVKEGDQIDAHGKRYSVKAVSRFQGAGLLDHVELILVSQDNEGDR